MKIAPLELTRSAGSNNCSNNYSKARKYVNTEDLDLPASLARVPNLANANVTARCSFDLEV